jgi:carbamoyl-phosphate synthase large subunit
VIVQYGGQTPLKLARDPRGGGVPIIGTSPDAIDRAEDRERFQQLITNWTAAAGERHRAQRERGDRAAAEIGYPLVVRPSYVLGGRAMEIVYDEEDLRATCASAVSVSECRRRCCSTAS